MSSSRVRPGTAEVFPAWPLCMQALNASLRLVLGGAVYVGSRMAAHESVLGRVTPPIGDLMPEIEGAYQRILVVVHGHHGFG